MITVSEYMTENVVTVSSDDTILHARNLMLRFGVGRLVVVKDDALEGILTLTDIMYALSMPEYYYKPAVDILVRDVMTANPITVRGDTSVRKACELMLRYNIGGLPVVSEDKHLEGIFTRTDAVRAYYENVKGMHKGGESMDVDPPRVSPYASFRKVIEVMELKPYMKALVVEGDKLLGIIAKKDVTFIQIPQKALDKPYIKRESVLSKGKTGALRYYIMPIAMEIMTGNPITGHPEDDLSEIAYTMLYHRIGAIPIVDMTNKLIGLVAKQHILEKIVVSKM